MNEQLSNIIGKGIASAEQTGEFIIEQAPLLMQEFYKLSIFQHFFWLIFSILFFFFTWYIVILMAGKKESTLYDNIKIGKFYYNDDIIVVLWLIRIIGSAISIFTFVINIYYLFSLLIAPKIYIIEYYLNK